MPYGCLDAQNLSEASRKAMEKALERWQKSMQITRPKTFLVLATHDDGSGPELELRKALMARYLSEAELSAQVIAVRAKDEEELALKIAQNKAVAPVQSLILYAESRHALSIRPIFKRRFGKALEVKTFKVDFEFNHPWFSTASSLTWLFRNLALKAWFEIKKRMGRQWRKKLKSLFWS